MKFTHLIPAGTGFRSYLQTDVRVSIEEAEEEEEAVQEMTG